jgi:hypothetical protein
MGTVKNKIVLNYEATTVDLKWNGKTYRVHPDTAKLIQSKKDYSPDKPVKKDVKVKK